MDSPSRTIQQAMRIKGCGKRRERHADARVTTSAVQVPFIMQPAASTTQLAIASQNA